MPRIRHRRHRLIARFGLVVALLTALLPPLAAATSVPVAGALVALTLSPGDDCHEHAPADAHPDADLAHASPPQQGCSDHCCSDACSALLPPYAPTLALRLNSEAPNCPIPAVIDAVEEPLIPPQNA